MSLPRPRTRPTRSRGLLVAVLLLCAAAGALVAVLLSRGNGGGTAAPTTTEAEPSTPSTVSTLTSSTTTSTTKPPKPRTLDGGLDLPLPVPTRNVWHTYVVDLVFGRTDGTTARPGALRVWADGSNTPVIDVTNVNTLQRADGKTQKWIQLWEGDYTRNLQSVSTVRLALTRIGTTLAQAMADRPTVNGTTVSSCLDGDYLTFPCGGLAPLAVVPEADLTVLLPLLALLMLGVGVAVRRRRTVA